MSKINENEVTSSLTWPTLETFVRRQVQHYLQQVLEGEGGRVNRCVNARSGGGLLGCVGGDRNTVVILRAAIYRSAQVRRVQFAEARFGHTQ